MREGVAEEAADAQRHVDAGPAELGQRHDLEAGDALGLLVPRRAHAEQGEGLGDVVAVGAHRRRAPQHEADGPGMGAGLGEVALDEAVGQGRADLPRQPGRDRLGVDGVEVAAGRQHVGGAAARRPARPGRDVAPGQPGEQVGDLVDRSGAGPARGGRRPTAASDRSSTSGPSRWRRAPRPASRHAASTRSVSTRPAVGEVDAELGRRPSPAATAPRPGAGGSSPARVDQRVVGRRASPRTCRPPRIWASLSAHR